MPRPGETDTVRIVPMSQEYAEDVCSWRYPTPFEVYDMTGAASADLMDPGAGLGRAVITAGLEFGKAAFAPPAFRVTVAAFNTRALKTVQSLGFEQIGSFNASHDGRQFHVLVRRETR